MRPESSRKSQPLSRIEQPLTNMETRTSGMTRQIVDARDHGLLIWAEPCLLLDLFPLFNLCSTCCSLNIFNSQGEHWTWELRYPYPILEHLGLNPGSNFLLIRAPEGSSDGSRNEAPGLIWKMFELLTLFFSLANPQSHSHLGEELRHPY